VRILTSLGETRLSNEEGKENESRCERNLKERVRLKVRVPALHIADGRVETNGPVMMSGHCSLSVGIAQQNLQSCCREMWRRAFSIQFLSTNYTFSKSGWLIHCVVIILTKHATFIRYSNSDPWPLFPIFDWSKLLAGFLIHFWPRSRIVNHAGLATQTVPGSALIIRLFQPSRWLDDGNCTALVLRPWILYFLLQPFWSLVAALYTIYQLPLGASVTVLARLQAGWPRMHGFIPGRGKSFLSVPESCEIGFVSQWLLVALLPKLRRPGRGGDHISVCRGFKNVCVGLYICVHGVHIDSCNFNLHHIR